MPRCELFTPAERPVILHPPEDEGELIRLATRSRSESDESSQLCATAQFTVSSELPVRNSAA